MPSAAASSAWRYCSRVAVVTGAASVVVGLPWSWAAGLHRLCCRGAHLKGAKRAYSRPGLEDLAPGPSPGRPSMTQVARALELRATAAAILQSTRRSQRSQRRCLVAPSTCSCAQRTQRPLASCAETSGPKALRCGTLATALDSAASTRPAAAPRRCSSAPRKDREETARRRRR